LAPRNRSRDNRKETMISRTITLIGPDGKSLGQMSKEKGEQTAKNDGLDLVPIGVGKDGNTICKVLDYGKYKYEKQKKENAARRNSATTQLKEVKLRVSTDEHDVTIKANNIIKFLSKGNKVKVSIRFRGRENLHKGLGKDMLMRICEIVKEVGEIDKAISIEGNSVSMMLKKK